MIDVANLAKVSKSTVSQYINNRYEFMSLETKDRIELAIKELNYVPNHLARSLKTNKTKTIGLIVRDVAGAFSSTVIRGIDDYCKKNKYNVIIYNTDFDPEVEKSSLKLLKEIHVDGIIIMSSGKNNDLIIHEQNSNFPIVLVQLEYDEVNTSIVISDYRSGSFDATEYLIKLGHKRICFVTQEFEECRSRYLRFQGYLDAIKKNNIKYDENLIQIWDREKGFNNTPQEMLNIPNPPTAFFTQHLTITIDLLQAFNKLGINIPQDISIIGFDEIPMVDLFKVPVTVVAQSPYKMGNEAAKLLLQKVIENNNEVTKTILPCSLIERSSCKNIL